MKIGILTLPLEANYGGILQAYALQFVLKEQGHEVFTIDWHNRKCYKNRLYQLRGFIHRLFDYYVKKKCVTTLWNPFVSEAELEIISSKMKTFVSSHICLTNRVYPDEIKEIDRKFVFDAYIVGSDQVWAPSYSYNSCLSFVKRSNVRRITYAASAGSKNWMDNESEFMYSLPFLKKFDGISVREETLGRKVTEKTGMDASHVLDPTMLLDKEHYKTLFLDEKISEDYICTYILDSDISKLDIIRKVSNILHMPVKSAGMEETFKKGLNPHNYIQPSIEDWLKTYSNAKFVITDSFHGTVFSIIFNKPFIVIGNKDRGIERFQSLLRTFNLENRLLVDISKIQELVSTNIDYEKCNNLLAIKRTESLAFLFKYLNN